MNLLQFFIYSAFLGFSFIPFPLPGLIRDRTKFCRSSIKLDNLSVAVHESGQKSLAVPERRISKEAAFDRELGTFSKGYPSLFKTLPLLFPKVLQVYACETSSEEDVPLIAQSVSRSI
jgi:hypothetical protein